MKQINRHTVEISGTLIVDLLRSHMEMNEIKIPDGVQFRFTGGDGNKGVAAEFFWLTTVELPIEE